MEENEIKTDDVETKDGTVLGEEAAEVNAEEASEASAEKPEKKEKKAEKKKAMEMKLLAEMEALKEKLLEEEDKYLRLAAEYDNFRRRSQKEKEGIYADAMCDAVKEILPLFDNLERAGKFTDAQKVAEGLAMMAKISDAMLERLGVTRFGEKGDKFDPAWHNAVMHIDDDAYGENEIVDVYEVGYRRGDKVIRFAMVRVAN